MVGPQPDGEWTEKTDVWQFGQMAREVILGFPSDNSYRDAKELKEEISLPDCGADGVRCDLPESVKAMLRGCLDLEPEKRPAVREIVAVLTDAANALSAPDLEHDTSRSWTA